jgi:hypothetical protein
MDVLAVIGYFVSGGAIARVFYVHAVDHWRMDDCDIMFLTLTLASLWPVMLPVMLAVRLINATVFAPTPGQRRIAAERRHDREMAELARMQSQNDEIVSSLARRFY